MSYEETEGLTKMDLKNKFSQIGMPLERNDYPREYYAQFYPEKSNSKNKITRDNTPLYRNQMLLNKRGREKGEKTDEELMEDLNYEEEYEEEEEEEEEIIHNENDDSFVYEESKEKGEKPEKREKEEKEKCLSKRKSVKKKKIDIKSNDYRESGIKITRLIRKKKEKIPSIKVTQGNQDNVKRKILINYDEMAGQNDQYNNNNSDNIFSRQNFQNKNINLELNSNTKNNDFYDNKNYNLLNKNNEIINLKVGKIDEDTKNNDYNKNVNLKSSNNLKTQNKNSEMIEQNNIVSFGAPKNTEQTYLLNISNGPISFGVSENSPIFNNKNNKQNLISNNTGKTNQYDVFIKSISENMKDDMKDNQKGFNLKKVVLKWDTPKQKEFLHSSMEKEQTFRRPIEEESNNLNKVNLQNQFDDKKDEKEEIDMNTPKNQIVTNSIQNTIINEYDDNNKNKIEINDNKSKLRSYSNQNRANNLNNNKTENLLNEENYNNEIEYKDSDFQNDDYKMDINTLENNYNNQNGNIDDYGKFINNTNNNFNNMDNNQTINKNITQKNLINFNSVSNNGPCNLQKDYYSEGKDIGMNDNNIKCFTNAGNDSNNNYNMPNYAKINDLRNPYVNKSYDKEEDIISYNNERYSKMNANISNEQNMNNDRMISTDLKINYQREETGASIESSENNKGKIKKYGSKLKKNAMNIFKKNAYLWPLIILILFGIVFLLNYKFDQMETTNIFIIFTVIMALLLLYNLLKYRKILKNYKKMAKEDRDELINYLDRNNIKREEFGNNLILTNNFIKSRVLGHKISSEEYMNYVFPYLSKLLKKDKYDLKIDEIKNEGIKVNFWKEI